MKLSEMIVGKTIAYVEYHDHEYIGIEFTDDTSLHIDQTSQTGTLKVKCMLNDVMDELGLDTQIGMREVIHVEADDKEEV